MAKGLFNVILPYVHLDSLHSTQFHLPFHLHFIIHLESKLRQIYQLANGGPVAACTPWHTWISLITSLALQPIIQCSRLPAALYVCKFQKLKFKCVCVCVHRGVFDSWLRTTFLNHRNTSPPIPTMPGDWNSVQTPCSLSPTRHITEL